MKYEHEIRAWIINYIPLFYVDVVTYLYPDPDADLANVYQ